MCVYIRKGNILALYNYEIPIYTYKMVLINCCF